jgi:hypothetical protein
VDAAAVGKQICEPRERLPRIDEMLEDVVAEDRVEGPRRPRRLGFGRVADDIVVWPIASAIIVCFAAPAALVVLSVEDVWLRTGGVMLGLAYLMVAVRSGLIDRSDRAVVGRTLRQVGAERRIRADT